jgi:alpha-beta hydrolase superfamily lysophospholipase
VLFGHSLGGLITAASIVRERGNIAAAIISASAMQTPSKRWERVLSKISTPLHPRVRCRYLVLELRRSPGIRS